MDDYRTKQLKNGRFEVTGRIQPVSQDRISHPDLAKALIEAGAVSGRQFAFHFEEDGFQVVFSVKVNNLQEVFMGIQNGQGIMTAAITHALALQPFLKALALLDARDPEKGPEGQKREITMNNGNISFERVHRGIEDKSAGLLTNALKSTHSVLLVVGLIDGLTKVVGVVSAGRGRCIKAPAMTGLDEKK